MKRPAAKVRRKAARDGEHVLARRRRLDAVVCGWLWPEPELLLWAAGLRWEARVLRGRHRVSTAGLRWDHVRFGLGFVVAENAVFDRRGSARCCCLFAVRIAVYQVTTTRTHSAEIIIQIISEQHVQSRCVFAEVWNYLISPGWAGWEIKKSWVAGLWCNGTTPHPTHTNTQISLFPLLLAVVADFYSCALTGASQFLLRSDHSWKIYSNNNFKASALLITACSEFRSSHIHLSVIQGQSDMMHKVAFLKKSGLSPASSHGH